MPGYKGHIAGATALFALVWCAIIQQQPVTASQVVEWFLCTLLGALFPDIDIKSKGQLIFYRVAFGYLIFLWYIGDFQQCALVGVCLLVPLLGRHRGIFHNIGFNALLCVLLYYFFKFLLPSHAPRIAIDLVYFFMGACSHIVLDRTLTALQGKRR